MNEIKLIEPTISMSDQVMDYRQEFLDFGELKIPGSCGLHSETDYLKYLDKVEIMKTRDDGRIVPSTQYFAFYNDCIVGSIQIRHKLNSYLLFSSGHIGYSVRPNERRKGYAAQMLSLALIKCKELGIEKALVTCDKNNAASARTILKNGGVLENEILQDNGEIIQRYWINIAEVKN